MTEETITRYVAEDGKVFDDEDECREYEGSLYAEDVSFFTYSDDTIEQLLPTMSECILTCDIIVIRTIEGASWVQESCYEWGIKSPFSNCREFKTGIFVYNKDVHRWNDWEEYFRCIAAKNEQIMKLLET